MAPHMLHPAREPDNYRKLVLPAQSLDLGRRGRMTTAAGKPIHLRGVLMGGGASTDAMKEHLAAGLPLSASEDAARSIHNDLARVRALGVDIRPDAPPGATGVPRVIRPSDILVEHRGEGVTARTVHHLLPPSADALRLLAYKEQT